MGVSNIRLVRMSLLQALVVGAVGYGLGVGGAALFGVILPMVVTTVSPAFNMTPAILGISAAAVLVIVLLASLVSISKVLVLEPAVVFK
jgi:putative ABC transport system permease protein